MDTKEGLIRLIVIIIIGVLALSYFGVNLREIASSEVVKTNFDFIWEQISLAINYIKQIIAFLASWILQTTAKLKDILR